MKGGGAHLSRPTTGLAVDGHHVAVCQHGQHLAHPAHEGRPEFVGINRRKDPAKGVVRGDALFEFQILPQPLQLLFRPSLDFDKGVGP